jgi:hypothetical protein
VSTAIDLGVIRGLIELEDKFTSQIGFAEASLQHFTESNRASLTAVGQAVGLVTAAIGVMTTAVIALGSHGSDVNDVSDSLTHFAGSAENAEKILSALRDGTKGTVDDFVLMKDASHLLSANVKLNADDFGTLGQAAFVLQNRGLGGTKEMLELVSDAMVTGRTRALAMALGVVDAGDAEAKYARQLGVTVDQLSETGKAEAKRLAIMDMLKTAVKDAGAQERDFGEELEYVKAQITNWVDALSSAIAKSPVLAAGLHAVEDAINATFGGDKAESIKTVVDYINTGATFTVNFGLAAVETARVFNVAWSLVKTAVLAVEGAISLVIAGITDVGAAATQVAGAMHLVPDSEVQRVKILRDEMRAVVKSFADQADEAAKGVTGNSEFDKTLDKLGGTLLNVKDSMEKAGQASAAASEEDKIHEANAKKLAATQHEVAQSMIDREKVETELWKIEEKSLKETEQVWDEYFALRVQHGGSAAEAQRAQIERWFNDEVAKLDGSDRNWQEHYNALKALADEKLQGIAVDWDYMATHSRQALQDQADVARNTYNAMMLDASNFTREALEEQRQKMVDTAMAARGLGKDYEDAMKKAKDAAAVANAELAKTKKAAEEAAQAMRRMGSSFTYDLTTKEGLEIFHKMNPAATSQWSDEQIMAFAKKGGTLEQLVKSGIINLYGGFNPGGSSNKGFAQGGTVLEAGPAVVGENGPEIVNLPRGASVTPNHAMGGGGLAVSNHFYVNGTAEDVAKKISDVLMRQLKQQRQFGAPR